MSVSNPTLITFVIYIAAMVLIGFMAYRSTNNLSDYILGGRSLGSVVTALSAGASDMSGWLLMGLPGAIYMSGLSESWIAIGLIVGAYLNWLFVAGRLRVQTEHNGDALTLPDYFSSRFEDKSGLLRIISAVVILVFFTIYCASGIVAGARLFESTFGMSYETALWAGAAATIAYTFVGGFLAVSWTDTVQATLMIFALLLTPIIVLLATGGVDTTFLAIEAQDAKQLRHAEKHHLHRHHLADGLGPGLLRPAAHPRAFHGGGFGQVDRQRSPHLHDLDDPVPGRHRGGRFLRYRLLLGAP